MSLKPVPFGEIPPETVRVAQAAFRKGTLCMRIRDAVGPVFADEQFAELFSGRGRAGWSPARLAWVLALQFVENLTDRAAADAVRSRIDWKYLLSLDLEDPGFDFSVLSEFRDRLVGANAQRAVLDTLLDRLTEEGIIKVRGKARTDSTHVLAAVAALNRLENVFITLQAALVQVAETAPEWLGSWMSVEWQKLYEVPFSMPKSAAARARLGARIGVDGWELWTRIIGADAPEGLDELPAVRTLRLVWLQQFYRDSTSTVIWRDNDKHGQPPASIRIDSPFDIEARRAVKRGTGWTGYKDHYTETYGDPDTPNMITDAECTAGPVHDGTALAGIHDRLAARGRLPGEHVVDSAYADPEAVITARDTHGITLIAPLLHDHSWQARAGEGFDQTRFTIDWDAQRVTCPEGATSQSWGPCQSVAGPRIQVKFAAKDCGPCPSRVKCVRGGVRPRRGLTLHPRPEHELLMANRRDQTSSDWKARYAGRAGVEGTMSQAVSHGARRTRYIGLGKKLLQANLIATGINIVRIGAWLIGALRATTRTSPIRHLSLASAA
jgi:transposase